MRKIIAGNLYQKQDIHHEGHEGHDVATVFKVKWSSGRNLETNEFCF